MGLVGSDPFAILGGLKVTSANPSLGQRLGWRLVISRRRRAGRLWVYLIRHRSATGTPRSSEALGILHINLTGTTQFRLYFTKDDNDDNGADYMKFFSGNYATATARPTLIIEYYVP